MPLWIASFALKGWGFLKAGFTWLFSDIRHLLIVVLGLAALWGWHEHSGKLECQRNDSKYRAEVKAASAANAAAQAKLIADQKAKFDASAEKANATYEAQLALARSAADRYKLTHIVRAGTTSVSGGTSSQKGDPAGPVQEPAAATIVYVTEPDYDACVTDYAYAKAAYDWAQDLVSKGAAEFSPTP